MGGRISGSDLELVAFHGAKALRTLEGKNLFITGGTGFFGKWILESIAYFNQKYAKDSIRACVLSRDPDYFLSLNKHLDCFQYLRGDVLSLEGSCQSADYMIHAATPASADLNQNHPLKMLDLTYRGSVCAFDFARRAGVKRALHTSSGAVYGPLPPQMGRIKESYLGGPDVMHSGAAYAEGKRLAELVGNLYSLQDDLEVVHARCFCFAGAYLPLNAHFAFGNFIADALAGRETRLSGDGSPQRSYMYAADLVVWLLHLLVFAKSSEAYNVGSEEAVSVAELAVKIQQVSGSHQEVVRGPSEQGGQRNYYIPDTQKSCQELGLRLYTSLDQMILKTLDAYRARQNRY